jgi:hypothetical protein
VAAIDEIGLLGDMHTFSKMLRLLSVLVGVGLCVSLTDGLIPDVHYTRRPVSCDPKGFSKIRASSQRMMDRDITPIGGFPPMVAELGR